MSLKKDAATGQGDSGTPPITRIARPRGNGNTTPPTESAPEPADNRIDAARLDDFEQLARDAILDDQDGDEPGAEEEINTPLVEKNLPRFARFRSNPVTFELWGATDQQGMDELLFVTTKKFAPNFEDDVDLRRVRFYETVTPDGVVRLIYAFVPETTGKKPNTWLTSKIAALEASKTQWTTMRSRRKLLQYTYRPSRNDYGEPKFSGRTPGQWIAELKKMEVLVDSKDHPYYKKATDTE
jgi:hypothetical protein